MLKGLQEKGGVMVRILKQIPDGISGLELLLDETICNGHILIDKQLLMEAGGINHYLQAKQKYELLIRVAFKTPIAFVEEKAPDKEYILLEDDEIVNVQENGWKTDCYVTGMYSHILQKEDLLNTVIMSILQDAEDYGRKTETLEFLEQMVSRKRSYWDIAEGSCPILVYTGEKICYNVLNIFAEQFGNALTQMGKKVIYFDSEEQSLEQLTEYMGQHFQAVIGIQTYLFSVKLNDGIHYVHEYIYGPKYNFSFDHPIWMRKHLEQHYDDFYILTHDSNYIEFLKRYYQQKAILFPPAGIVEEKETKENRIYDLTFVGSYGNYWNEVLLIHRMEREKRFLANQFLFVMRKNPDYTAEKALEITLKKRQIYLSDGEFFNLLYEFRRVIYCVMHYYREKTLREILESGIQVDVFGNSWSKSSLCHYENLVCHADVTVEESLEVWRKSKLSLNIMSWHKGGFTERMANIMLLGAVLVTDETSYLEGRYSNEDIICFSLRNPSKMCQKIQKILDDEKMRHVMAENAKKKTLDNHTWKKRAEEFQNILDERMRCRTNK